MTPGTGGRPRGDGRTRLLDAAEVLLDQAGIDGTTAAAVTQAAGHRNAAAVNYHFGTLDNLIEAVLRRHADRLDVERHRLLDDLEAAGPADLRTTLTTVLRPLADLLEQPEGRRYLRLLNQAASHPQFRHRSWQFTPSIARGALLLAPLIAHLSPERRQDRARQVVAMIIHALADQAWYIDHPPPDRTPLPTEVFLEDLIDAAMAAFAA